MLFVNNVNCNAACDQFLKAKDDLYTYHGTDVLVQTSWELPIVVGDHASCPSPSI